MTKMIIKNRGTGKTTQLIYTSATTGYPIIVDTKGRADFIDFKAKELNCQIPKPMSVAEWFRTNSANKYNNILIDEICTGNILDSALKEYFGANVVASTCSPDNSMIDTVYEKP